MSGSTDNSKELQPAGTPLSQLSDTSLRHGFIRKVYGILSAQLIVTIAVGGCVMMLAETMVKNNPNIAKALLYGSLAVVVGVMCIFICSPRLMRRVPANYALLLVFTLAESVMVGFICASYTQESVLIALGLTALVVVGLTLFACQTSCDFTGLGPYLFCAVLVLMGFGFMLMLASFVGLGGTGAFTTLRLVYACGGALLFSVFIVYDTQLILGGKHKHKLGLDDYAVAAINLYMDIIQLFLFLLQIFGQRK